jgi:aminoglycoside phosphotransferase family enzyme/predicted kinase
MLTLTHVPDRLTGEVPAQLDQAKLVESLREPAVFGPGTGEPVSVIETHISYVLLTGPYAYKIKKAVDLQFLNFSTLPARRHYCDEELRLNRPLAPSVYLDIVAITGTVDAPVIGGDGPVLEYAVKMRQFGPDAPLSDMLARGTLTDAHIDQLAAVVASFHGATNRAAADAPYGRLDDILRPALENFTQLLAVVDEARDRSDLESLRAWTGGAHTTGGALFLNRRRLGFVRECHGDLHLGNIALIDGRVTLFDRLEFSESMRWIDVMNDVAFVIVDLQERKRPDLAVRFLTAYLEATGDYEGLGVLRFYVVYRAMVRAKVSRFRMRQLKSPDERERLQEEYRAFVDLARRHSQPLRAAIIITHGLAGAGKTTCAQSLLERTGGVRIRTDVERKRLHGVEAGASSASPVGEGLSTAQGTLQTYIHVCALARSVAEAGYIAIVDGAFLKRWQRKMFRETAAAHGLPFSILAVSAPDATLRERIARRRERGEDASEATIAVLEAQLRAYEPLDAEEQKFMVQCDTGGTNQEVGMLPILDGIKRSAANGSRLSPAIARRHRTMGAVR